MFEKSTFENILLFPEANKRIFCLFDAPSNLLTAHTIKGFRVNRLRSFHLYMYKYNSHHFCLIIPTLKWKHEPYKFFENIKKYLLFGPLFLKGFQIVISCSTYSFLHVLSWLTELQSSLRFWKRHVFENLIQTNYFYDYNLLWYQLWP